MKWYISKDPAYDYFIDVVIRHYRIDIVYFNTIP